jgi:ubiquinone/menaquinone biosynthesis C-methylase UbiE
MRHARPAAGWTSHARQSFARARAGRSRLSDDVLSIHGFCTPTKRHFLNNACAFPGANYLEIGTWKGATFFAAACGNEGRFTGVDDFSEFLAPRDEFYRHLRARARRGLRFVEGDCWKLPLRRLPRDVNVYFYDGSHTRDDHYHAFARFDRLFAPTFLALVDDWSRPQVREAWWNGFYAAVVRRPPPRR